MVDSERPIIFGEVLYDCFPDGQAVLGGAPFNVAWHLQGFGLNPLFISRVGDDPLGHLINQMVLPATNRASMSPRSQPVLLPDASTPSGTTSLMAGNRGACPRSHEGSDLPARL